MSSLPNSHVITTRETLIELVARPFHAFVDILAASAERNPRVIAINRVNALSDAELAAKGTNRADAIRAALGVYL